MRKFEESFKIECSSAQTLFFKIRNKYSTIAQQSLKQKKQELLLSIL